MAKLALSDPTGVIQQALQRALDLVSFGLHASDRLEIQSLSFPARPFQMAAARNLSMSVEEARGAFRFWILANGLRDCVDAIGPSLEWARKMCFFWTCEGEVTESEGGKLHLSAQLTTTDWNEGIIEEARQFEYWPLRKKLEHLVAKYGLPRPELSEAVLSLSYARNCLTHRMGIVGTEDLLRNESDTALKVSWRRLKLLARGEQGDRELIVPATVEAGEAIAIGFSDVEKQFPLGDRIDFTPAEFQEIVTTFLLFALQVQTGIHDLKQRRKTQAAN